MPSTPKPSGSKKATAKRKHCSRSSNAPVPKRSTERSGNISQLQPAQDPVMTALQSIQLSISNLDTRIQMLENRPASLPLTTAITSPSLAPTAPDAAAALATASASGFAGLLQRLSQLPPLEPPFSHLLLPSLPRCELRSSQAKLISKEKFRETVPKHAVKTYSLYPRSIKRRSFYDFSRVIVVSRNMNPSRLECDQTNLPRTNPVWENGI
ncbi:hypothetical protein DPX16_22651 [Anabarilius grahami]|uniref:Uncharacterized protein n=1 Tax=Anabarilius grahami TaxID=495550 RepID=A0A3N0XJS5_ANAGA|nr:hypothetical protein DPX16_22651 [Anabarilius grahami]